MRRTGCARAFARFPRGTFPLIGAAGAALAIRSHFFEFLPADAQQGNVTGGSPVLAHQLETGSCYAVVMTTGGGLYRYQLHDLVEVVGHHGACPLLRFLGKGSHISDHFGEKLNERHVQGVLDTLFARYAVYPAFAMVALEAEAGRHAYTLFIETNEPSDETLRRLGLELETALQENYHYRYCRELGQLDALRIFRIRGGGPETYLAVCQARGQRAGAIKPAALHHGQGWSRFFHGGTL